jgi:hypothetical protein
MTWIGDGAHTARRTARRHTSTYRYVNGFSISVKTQLHPGDTITFGTGPTSQSSSTLCSYVATTHPAASSSRPATPNKNLCVQILFYKNLSMYDV